MGFGWEGVEVLSFIGDKRETGFSHFTERVCANRKVPALWGLAPGGFREGPGLSLSIKKLHIQL